MLINKTATKEQIILAMYRRLNSIPNNIALNNYLNKNYNMSLINTIFKIVNNIELEDNNSNYKVIIKSKELEKLARLIKYGNREVRGTNILDYIVKGD